MNSTALWYYSRVRHDTGKYGTYLLFRCTINLTQDVQAMEGQAEIVINHNFRWNKVCLQLHMYNYKIVTTLFDLEFVSFGLLKVV